ncbi:DUF2207 domain-containing protein [Secundilactobacillus paracollinoides]|uniref:DUF2207 domain-containing protein n=1 Tax=Secundilactobacillus paracollinoides TaxID=240427 RepID=UPI0006EEDAAE|nr:DUF2207 domain-containing protein [Secundilactobacillus paracollinoides]KRL76533.1 integral membrane protein [Secundilactobacillus paracollinoides DSM 15502 = JCM 11969]
MKQRRLAVLVAILAGVVTMGITTTQAHAREYTINKYHINVAVDKNGNAELTQNITYKFDGSFNGVYYNQDITGIKGLKNPQITATQDGRETTLRQSNSEAANTYQTTASNKNYRFKVFYPTSDSQVTFQYKYQLDGVITNYIDTAQLNWKIIGSKWDVPLNNVKIKVALPAKNIDKLQAWTHGPLSGHTAVNRQAGTVTMTVDEVPANTFVESHMLFPTSVTPTNTNKKNTRHLKQAQQQEATLAKQANQKRFWSRMIPLIAGIVILLIGAWHYLYQRRWFNTHPAQHITEQPDVHNYEIPAYDAVTSQVLLSREDPTDEAFSAWLMELAAAGEITIAQEDGKHHKKTYRLTETTKLTAEHKKNKMLNFIFDQVGEVGSDDHRTVTLAEINRYTGHGRHNNLYDKFSAWQSTTYTRVKNMGLFNDINQSVKNHGWMLIIINGVLSFAGILVFAFADSTPLAIGWLLTLILFILSLVTAISRMWHLSPYTQEGEDKVAPIQGFKDMLNDIGHFDRSEVGDLILWEQILPYAVAFGSAKKVIKALQANFTDAELQTGMPVYYQMFFYGTGFSDSFAGQFNTDFNANVGRTEGSSSTGGSGGFSGGSSGGFGGGSGGGVF